MDHFTLIDGALHAEQVPLARIADEVGSPVYVYSAATFRRHARVFRDALLPLGRSEEHTSELQSLMRISYAVFCLKKKKQRITQQESKNRIHHNEQLHEHHHVAKLYT